MRHIYEPVSAKVSKSGLCTVCGRKATRTKTFTNTVNPFNKNEDGTVRTRAEVWANVRRLAEEWKSLPVTHGGCE